MPPRTQSARLTDLQLQHWLRAARDSAPYDKEPWASTPSSIKLPLAKSDGGGLTFTLSVAGTASWILRYRYGGRQRELTLGNYPDMNLSEARRVAREKRVAIDTGADPAADKRRAVALVTSEWTVRKLINDYRQKILVGLGPSTQKSYGRNLTRIESKLGSLKVSQVSPLDIVSMLERADLKWNESRMMLSTARMVFRHAAGRRIIPANPCIGIELSAVLGKKPATRERLMLSELEIKAMFEASMSAENKLALKLLLGTAVRTDELRNAKWANVDLQTGVWHIPSTKTGRRVCVPLSTPVKRWFSQLAALSGISAYVLPSRAESRRTRQGGDAPINPNTLGAAVNFWLEVHKPEGVRRFTPHDLRSTAKSHMVALGVPRDITEMCLNHKLTGIEGIYNVYTYFDERKDAFDKWGRVLDRIEQLAHDAQCAG